MNTICRVSFVLSLFLSMMQLTAANPVAYWKMNEGKGQVLKNSCDPKADGFLGNSVENDAADPKRLKSDRQSVLYFEHGKCAVIPDGNYSDFSQAGGFAIQLYFKQMFEASSENPRIQILTKGADSARNSWQLRILYDRRENRNILEFIFKDSKNKYKSLSAPIIHSADKWSRTTVTGNGKELKLYLNGKLIKQIACNELPHSNRYPLKIGTYAFGNKFSFVGNISNLKIYKSAIIPSEISKKVSDEILLDSNFKYSGVVKEWKAVNGKWFWSRGAYCEYSDSEEAKGVWSVAGKPDWNNYCLEVNLSCFDSIGSVLLGAYWKNVDNHYEVKHQRYSSGMNKVTISEVKNGKSVTLAAFDNSDGQLTEPVQGKKLRYKIYVFNRIIAVMINGKFVLSAETDIFSKGKVALGEQQRKIRVSSVRVRKLTEFSNPLPPAKRSKVAVRITQSGLRHAFFRGEKIHLDLSICNNMPEPVAASSIKFTVDNGIGFLKTIKVPVLRAELAFNKDFVIDTKDWKSGQYKLTAQIENSDYKGCYDIFIAPEKRKDAHNFFSWGGRSDAPFFKSLQEHGFSGTSIALSPSSNFSEQRAFLAGTLDQAVKYGQSIKVNYNCLWQKAPGADSRMIRYDGNRGAAPNPRHPVQRKWALQKVDELTAMLNGHPAVSGFLLNSENENIAEPDYSPAGRKLVKKELGFDIPVPENKKQEKDGTAGRLISVPKVVKADMPAVFPDNNKWYKFFKWFWQCGYGDNYLNEELKNIIKQRFPNAKVTHDPFRDVPLFYRNRGLDQVGTWFYTHPDASETLGAAETLVNAAQDESKRKGINFGASLWLYANRICPAKQTYAGVQPTDIIIESDWLAFSRIPEEIEHFSLTHLMPSAKPQFKQKNIYDKLAQFSRQVLQPLWPTVSRLNRAPRDCAMLLSFGNQLFGNKTWSGYGCSTGFGYYAALQMAHIPTDIIFDENIQRGDLQKYKILFMHDIKHLPKSVFNKIVAFAEKGGTVVCGAPFAKLIPGAVDFDMDMTKRKKSTYYHIKNKGGFAADVVYQDMKRNAAAVRKMLKNKLSFYADCDSHSAFINVLEKYGRKYVFVVNDKRTFGDYVGKKYRAVMEQGVPQKLNVMIKSDNAVVYDLVSHIRLKSFSKAGQTVVPLTLKPAWGAVLAVYEQDIKRVEISLPQVLRTGNSSEFVIKVIGNDGKAMTGIQPVEVIISDPEGKRNEFSGYFAAENGVSRIKFIPAKNDLRGKWTVSVKELSSGIQIKKNFVF